MATLTIVLLILGAYLLGSIPTAVWIGKAFYGIDVREFGSGNAGATNTFRVLGKKAGFPVLAIDILKGSVAVALAFLSSIPFERPDFVDLQLGLGVAVLLGHIFPVFAGFRGGKGVATILGVVLCVLPITCCVGLLVFFTVLLATRYVSLSSMMTGIAFPFILQYIMHNEDVVLTIFSITVAVLLVLTHRKNIIRLFKNQESKINLFQIQNKS
ncbi:MAG: glycerol-3-phosphate 1-O-acyltransferase PlsY [Bacteroidota bacterium]|nr:glycerol-3-phosphate 1-O-acyltransferase PlsY [Bacteroidota bacterium]